MDVKTAAIQVLQQAGTALHAKDMGRTFYSTKLSRFMSFATAMLGLLIGN